MTCFNPNSFPPPSCCFQRVQRGMLFPLSALHSNLSASAVPQPQHQIGAQLSRAHGLTYLPSSAPPQAAFSNEQPRFSSSYPSRQPSSQWHERVCQNQLPTRPRGRRAVAPAVRDERRLAEIASCSALQPTLSQHLSSDKTIKGRRMPLFVSSNRAGLSWAVENSSLHHLLDPTRRQMHTDFCFLFGQGQFSVWS